MEQATHKPPQQPIINPNDETTLLNDPDRWNYIPYNELFVIRKQTIGFSMELAMKKLNREVAAAKHEMKKKTEVREGKIEFEFDNYPIKRQFSNLRELYCRESKSNIIMRKNLDKLKAKLDRATRQIKNQQSLNLKDTDIVKIFRPNQFTLPKAPQPTFHKSTN